MIIFSVDENGKSIVNLEGKSGKIISIGCCFPPKFANSGTLPLPLCPRTHRPTLSHHPGHWTQLQTTHVPTRAPVEAQLTATTRALSQQLRHLQPFMTQTAETFLVPPPPMTVDITSTPTIQNHIAHRHTPPPPPPHNIRTR